MTQESNMSAVIDWIIVYTLEFVLAGCSGFMHTCTRRVITFFKLEVFIEHIPVTRMERLQDTVQLQSM